MTLQDLYQLTTAEERQLPIEAVTHWECDSVEVCAAAVVDETRHVTTGKVVRSRCLLLSANGIQAGQTELDGGMILRVVVQGDST